MSAITGFVALVYAPPSFRELILFEDESFAFTVRTELLPGEYRIVVFYKFSRQSHDWERTDPSPVITVTAP